MGMVSAVVGGRGECGGCGAGWVGGCQVRRAETQGAKVLVGRGCGRGECGGGHVGGCQYIYVHVHVRMASAWHDHASKRGWVGEWVPVYLCARNVNVP